MRSRLSILLLVVLGLALAGPIACGKRGKLEAPDGKPSSYPRTYPAS